MLVLRPYKLTPEQKQKAIIYLKRLYDRVKAIGSIIPENTTNASDANISEISEGFEEDDEFLNQYLSHNFQPQNDDDMDAYSKL